jgi:quercetin dioxygenase-like cupin family protein
VTAAPGDLERRLRAEGLQPSRWASEPGDWYAAHDHPYDKVIAVEHGSIRFGLPSDGGSLDLEAGDRLELPAGSRHDAVVGPHGVGCLEAHVSAGTLVALRRRPSGEW